MSAVATKALRPGVRRLSIEVVVSDEDLVAFSRYREREYGETEPATWDDLRAALEIGAGNTLQEVTS